MDLAQEARGVEVWRAQSIPSDNNAPSAPSRTRREGNTSTAASPVCIAGLSVEGLSQGQWSHSPQLGSAERALFTLPGQERHSEKDLTTLTADLY